MLTSSAGIFLSFPEREREKVSKMMKTFCVRDERSVGRDGGGNRVTYL